MMKRFLLLLCIYVSIDTAGQTNQKDFLKDRDGNIYSIKLMPDNKVWMTDNLKINIPESFCYEQKKENCDQYGRLYTWKSAQIGCKTLGDGWRLPTTGEWRQMAKQFGGVFDDSQDSGKAAYNSLLHGGSAAFNVLLGGGRSSDGNYRRGNAHGFYWTATETVPTNAWFINFGKGSGKLFLQNNGDKPDAFSVRCLKDVNSVK